MIFLIFYCLGIQYENDEWYISIDGSTMSLKAVLIHKVHKLPSIPLAYSTVLKETYDNIKMVLNKIEYNTHRWSICCDFKVVAIISGLQAGRVKYPCFICLFDATNRVDHYTRNQWPNRDHRIGEFNAIQQPLVNLAKIVLPPLHIYLGLAKQFLTKLQKNKGVNPVLKNIFNNISDAKLLAGVLTGPQIHLLMQNEAFDASLTVVQLEAWTVFKWIASNFLGNKRASGLEIKINELMNRYGEMGCLLSPKMHMLQSHMNRFDPESCGRISDQHGEQFHQQIMSTEQRYKGKNYINMLAEYMWLVKYKLLNIVNK
jgi:hypothetical protein